jgi:di/tricarboxylate transporter
MTPAVASLLALLTAILVSCVSRLNVGVLALTLAWIVGVFSAGLSADAVAAGFPVSLFLTLAGVTLLFSLADSNGTVDALARRALRPLGGDPRLVAWGFFLTACAISAAGPGAIAAVALVAPIAMPLGRRSGLPDFLSALMVANGANAGNLSAVSAVGIIANTTMAEAGLGGHAAEVFAANFASHVLVTLAAFAALGGFRAAAKRGGEDAVREALAPMAAAQWVAVAVVGVWIAGVTLLRLPLGLSAFAAATALILSRAAVEPVAVARMPWGIILMVCGVSTLIALVEKTGGLALFTTLLSTLATPATVYGVMAFVTGVISTYSSTSGVVLPTFLPTVPGLIAQVGGGDPLALALSINVGSSLVDVSPLSTLGALCVAAVADPVAARDLFRRLLIWGLSMTIAGALLCQAAASLLAR